MKTTIFWIFCFFGLLFVFSYFSKQISDAQYEQCVSAGIHKNEQCRHWAYDE